MCRRKLQSQLKDIQEQLSASEAKYSSMEKTKNRIAAELEDVTLDLEKVQYTVKICILYC